MRRGRRGCGQPSQRGTIAPEECLDRLARQGHVPGLSFGVWRAVPRRSARLGAAPGRLLPAARALVPADRLRLLSQPQDPARGPLRQQPTELRRPLLPDGRHGGRGEGGRGADGAHRGHGHGRCLDHRPPLVERALGHAAVAGRRPRRRRGLPQLAGRGDARDGRGYWQRPRLGLRQRRPLPRQHKAGCAHRPECWRPSRGHGLARAVHGRSARWRRRARLVALGPQGLLRCLRAVRLGRPPAPLGVSRHLQRAAAPLRPP
mmetsp:Transcript_150545/g.464559  ORF Transcript_150545/g.464559 Transcript_150545/m.464559 type:complete len:261 (-) Transcript_150545:420-1202(-)